MKKSLVIFLLIVLVLSCSKSKETVNDFSIINLKWNQSYSSQTIEDVTKGLNWTLSNIGVSLKFSSSDYLQVSNSILELNIKALNFESNGREILLKLHESIYSSDEYILNNSVDIGRYVCLLIGAPNHYNELVGVPNSLQDILSKYQLLPDKGKINNSSISLVDRVIEYSLQENELQLLLSTEVDSATNSIYEFETIEIMKNGQLKFGVYDKNGFLKTAADESITNAGKIAKCMWCHESNIAQLINSQTNEPGFLSSLQLENTLRMYNQKLFSSQVTRTNNVVDYINLQEHTKMELLYISFMNPSAQRLSEEWNMSQSDVFIRLSSLARHTYSEFPFLGLLYHRDEVKRYAPVTGLAVSSSVREKSLIEVNHL